VTQTQINPQTQIQRDKFEQLSKEVLLQLLDDPTCRRKSAPSSARRNTGRQRRR
jgi:hypothetical protein